MKDDELRTALARTDPAPRSLPPLSCELLERTMTHDTMTDQTNAASTSGAGSRRAWLAAAAAAVVLAGAGGAYVLSSGSDPAHDGGALELALPGGDPTMMSCLPVSENVETLRQMDVAFAGTATAVSDAEVRLDVERWYRGGDASAVVLRNAPEQQQALLGATQFEVGEEYLVSASAGTVSVCGLTGPVEPVLQDAYDEAYGG